MKKSTRNMFSKEKFLLVMETYTLSERELSKYCIKMGYMLNKLRAGVLVA
jgi:hypothetical protein